MATLTQVTNKSIADGDQELDAIDQSANDYLTMVVKYTGIDKDVKVKIEQTINDTDYADVVLPGDSELYINIKGSGTKALNIIGLNCSKIRAKIIVGKATAGTINKLDIYN
jgi:hypothetical protein